MDLAPDLKPDQKPKRVTNPTEIERNWSTFTAEARQFWKSKTNSGLAWTMFWMLNISNLLTIIYHCCPGWGWTTEVLGQEVIEGDVYGWYGLWYTCWQLADPANSRKPRSCTVVTDLDHVPDWWAVCQTMSVLALACGIAAFVFIMLYMFNSDMNRRLRMLFPYIICSVASGVFGMILFTTFCVMFLRTAFWCCSPDVVREILEWKLWYCFYLCGIGTTLMLAAGIAGVFEMFDVIKGKRKMAAYTGWLENEDEFSEMGPGQFPMEFHPHIMNNNAYYR